MNPKVSIIMRTKNADWVVSEALTSLFSQDFKDFEVLVVDSGSTDNTLNIVRQFPCQVTQIAADEYYPGKVLNQMAQQAKGEILVFQNSDVVLLRPDSLRQLLNSFDSEGVQAAFARQVPRPDAKTWVRRDYAVSFPEKGSPDWITLSLPLAAMRKSAWKKHPFYTRAWGSEDTEWGHWARQHGYSVAYVPEALVMHSHNYTLKQIYGRSFIEGEADAFIYKNSHGIPHMIRGWLGSILNDVKAHLKVKDFKGLGLAPLRRSVFHWGYFKGHRLGQIRRANKNINASLGQKVVLKNY